MIQWLESWRQREVLKLVFNRLVRIRMLGGVGGVRGNRAPIPIGLVLQLLSRVCDSRIERVLLMPTERLEAIIGSNYAIDAISNAI